MGRQAAAELGKKHSEEEGCSPISWPQTLSFLLRLEEKQPQPEFSPVDALLFFPPEARHSVGMSALCEEAPETALGVLIRGWEEEKPLSSLSGSNTAGRSSEPSSGNSQKEKLQCKALRPGI